MGAELLTTTHDSHQDSTGTATSKSFDSNATKSTAIDSKANETKINPMMEPKSQTTTEDSNQRSFDTDFFFSNFRNKIDPTADFILQDAFSASWWQSKDNFLRNKRLGLRTPSAEGASFEVFRINEKNMRVTRDWMDLNVEHMSKWWKVVLDPKANKDTDKKYHSRIIQIFEDYVYSSDRVFFWDRLDSNISGDWLEVSQSTIAVIAFMPNRGPGGDAITKWSLAATLMSLVQLGVGRIIISGVESIEKGEHYVQEAWKEVANATKDWKISREKQISSIGFCNCGDAHNDWKNDNGLNIPKTSLRRLRHVYLKENVTEEIRECWGGASTTTRDGDVMDRWQYVFLGEPDLILNTRPSVIAKLGKALKDGGVLAPHRLQPTPHDADFGYQNWTDILRFLVPNVSPKLDEIIEIDHYLTSAVDTKSVSCCDDGNKKPYMEIAKCDSWWWQCGYSFFNNLIKKHGTSYGQTVNETHLLEAYKRTILYPFVRLKRGTGVVFAGSAHGRRCLPSNGTCVITNRLPK